MRVRLKLAIEKLLKEPPEGDIKALVRQAPLKRLRVGNLRVIFYTDVDVVRVLKVVPRG